MNELIEMEPWEFENNIGTYFPTIRILNKKIKVN